MIDIKEKLLNIPGTIYEGVETGKITGLKKAIAVPLFIVTGIALASYSTVVAVNDMLFRNKEND